MEVDACGQGVRGIEVPEETGPPFCRPSQGLSQATATGQLLVVQSFFFPSFFQNLSGKNVLEKILGESLSKLRLLSSPLNPLFVS